MKTNGKLDCVLIGYNEVPFDEYEGVLREYGEDSEAYRDLKFSFVDLGDKKLDYVGLLNSVRDQAEQRTSANGARREYESGDIPNLAAVYLTNFLRLRGFNAAYINLFQHEKAKLIDYLSDDPLCVAITTTFYVLNLPVNMMVEFIRGHNKSAKIIVGGPLIANHARNYQGDQFFAALDDIGADIYVIEGQGEATLSQVVSCLKSGGDLSRVPNIIYRENGVLRGTTLLAENNSLDKDFIRWHSFAGEDLGRTIQTRTARSCAFKCSFCNYPTRAGKLTLAELGTLEAELDSIREIGNVKNVVFIDDTFNVPLPRFKEICRLMIKKDYRFNWFSYFRCSNSDDEAFDLMAASGCKGVFLGIESGSPQVLKDMNKAATVELYARGIERLHKYGILTFGSFIVGFPGETEETIQQSIDFIRATKPDYYRAQMWYCEPGTPIDQRRSEFNIDGRGFKWTHATMDSMEAMDHIERMFLTINESIWLPQWSFDFWIIPYLIGKGISTEQFKDFMATAHKLLALEIASVPAYLKQSLQQDYLQSMVAGARQWGGGKSVAGSPGGTAQPTRAGRSHGQESYR